MFGQGHGWRERRPWPRVRLVRSCRAWREEAGWRIGDRGGARCLRISQPWTCCGVSRTPRLRPALFAMVDQLPAPSMLSSQAFSTISEVSMNRYGLLALEQWSRYMPTRFAELEDPEGFFAAMGETIEQQVVGLVEELERQLTPTEDYLRRVGELNAVRRQAEESVLQELVYSQIVAEPSSDLETRLEEALSVLPTPEMLQRSIDQVWEWAEETRDADLRRQDETEVYLSLEDQETVGRLTRLLALVQVPAGLSEDELTTRIEQLEAAAQQNR